MLWGILLSLAAAAPQAPADTLVVCPPLLRQAMQPWIDYRSAQGHRIVVAAPPSDSAALQLLVRKAAAEHAKLRWVVLVGDAGAQPQQTATHIVPAKVNIHFGSEPEIATDNPTADTDLDGVPDLAIGRLPADSPQDLSRMIDKIIRYERARQGAWQRQVNFVAGVGGFGFVDQVIEMVTKRFLTDGIPACYHTTMTYGSWQSAYRPSPPSFHTATVERLNEGCLFWVYIGHGHRYQLDKIIVPGSRHHILDIHDMQKLRCRQGAAIAVMLACYMGAYDSPSDCIAEEMLRSEGGPVAVLAGSRVTMPYAMAVLGNGLLEQYFVHRRQTLGEVMLHAKRGLAENDPQAGQTGALGKNRQLLDMLAKAVSPKPELIEAERLEHLALFNLLGDPLLRIRYGEQVQLEAPSESKAGEVIEVSGHCDLPGQLRIELVCRRDRHKQAPPARPSYDESRDTLRGYDRAYVMANDRQWAAQEHAFSGGAFKVRLTPPAKCAGDCYVRAFVRGQNGHALGAAPVYINPVKDKAPATASLRD